MKYFVYIIQSKSTKKFYTGITSNLVRRIKQHNHIKSNCVVTNNLTDFELKYFEMSEDRMSARKREKYLKSGIGREYRNKIVKC